MGANSSIEWTTHTFNPWMGCVKISPACKFCYAETDRKMRGQLLWGPDAPRQITSEQYWKQPLKWDREARESGTRPRVFCGSLCDVMEDFDGEMIRAGNGGYSIDRIRQQLYGLVEATHNLDWLLLTKRPENYCRFLPASWLDIPRPNVWLGTTVEKNEYLWRADSLKSAPAVVHFLSIEPLLEDLTNLGEYLGDIEWVICGGESGHHARPMQADWARRIRDLCAIHQVPFLFKQWGEWSPVSGAAYHIAPPLVKIGKKASGRFLDARTWDEMPEVARV